MGLSTLLRRLIEPPFPATRFPGRIPDFFLVGAARSGTTSMWQYLRQHPRIFLTDDTANKEPSYFCATYGVRDARQYCDIFADAQPHQLIGDCSTPYLTSPESAGMIHRAAPDARILVLLRNPADRAFSLYSWMRAHGYESCESFEAALWDEDEHRHEDSDFFRSHGQYFHNFLYFRSGRYAAQVRRYFEVFGRAQVHVEIFDDLAAEPLPVMRRVFAFLGVDEQFVPQIEVHNAVAREGTFAPELRQKLLARYHPGIAELSTLLDRDLVSLWK